MTKRDIGEFEAALKRSADDKIVRIHANIITIAIIVVIVSLRFH